MTEHELDSAAKQFPQSVARTGMDFEPDLDVDGLTDSILSRLKRLLSSTTP